MKHRIIAIIIVTISITILSYVGFEFFFDEIKTLHSEPIENADIIYEAAANAIAQSNHITITVSTEKKTTIHNNLFLESSKKTVTYQNLGSNSQKMQTSEVFMNGTQEISFFETYSNNTVYQTVNEANFRYNLTFEHYLDKQIPVIILDPSLYTEVQGLKTSENYLIKFEGGKQPEDWVAETGSEFITSHGSAVIDFNENLQSSTYTLTYQQADAQVCITYHVEIHQKPHAISVPESTDDYIEINHPDGIRILEQAANYLIQSESISSEYEDEIYFEAFGDRRIQNIKIQAFSGNNWNVNIETTTKLTNDNKIDQVAEHHKKEVFTENQYSASMDGQSPEVNTQIDSDAMHNYLNNLLVSTVMLPQYVSDIKTDKNESYIRFIYTGTDVFATFLRQNACDILYQDATLLDESAQVTTKEFDCFLDIDPKTGFPIASGIHYVEQYSTNGMPTQLLYSAKQTYTFS